MSITQLFLPNQPHPTQPIPSLETWSTSSLFAADSATSIVQ